jgi:predicted DCC family thiol-disulfide oxidoreductase YuxK
VREPESKAIVLYDGVCGLCNRAVQFLLKRDSRDRLQFASLQSDLCRQSAKRHGIDPKGLDTVYAVLNYGEPNETLLPREMLFSSLRT